MNRFMKTSAIALALCASAVSAVAQGGGGAGKVSYSDLSVMMSTKNKDVMEHILISSWQTGGGAAGSDVDSDGISDVIVGASRSPGGHVKIFAGSVPASVARLCQSRATLPTVVLESDGKRHVLRNVVFDQCPAGGSTAGTFTLTFNGQTTSPIASGREASTLDRPNARIAGLTTGKAVIDVRLLSMKVRGNRATLIVAVPRTLTLPTPAPDTSAPAISEIVVTKEMDAASWSFSGAHVLYQDVSIPASARGSSKNIEMTIKILNVTIDFQNMKGSRADYNDPENPLR